MKLGIFNKFFARGLPVHGNQKTQQPPRRFTFLHTMPNGEKSVRVVEGKLINDFAIDYSKPLSEIKDELEYLLNYWIASHSDEVIEQIGRFPSPKEIAVHEGSNHIDVILVGKGSLDWLTVMNHYAAKLNRE